MVHFLIQINFRMVTTTDKYADDNYSLNINHTPRESTSSANLLGMEIDNLFLRNKFPFAIAKTRHYLGLKERSQILLYLF